jgi:hypothetical protein
VEDVIWGYMYLPPHPRSTTGRLGMLRALVVIRW